QRRERVEQMLADHLQRIANRGQIEGPVPLHEQLDVRDQLLPRRRWQRELQFAETGIESGLRRHALFFSAFLLLNPRFKCTSSNEMAAGVIPEIRAACRIVSGLNRFSFCCASTESPRTVL